MLLVEAVRKPSSMPARRLGRLGQRRQRHDRAQQVREHAVAVTAAIMEVGSTRQDAARLLHVTDRTLRDWHRRERLDHASRCLTGRPASRSTPSERNAVIDYLNQSGPGLGLHPLRDAFPRFTRAELDDLLHRYRRVWRERHRRPLHVLHWTTPGTVWAMDFAEAPNDIEGLGRILFAVRDLASGRHLLWQSVPADTAMVVSHALTRLFEQHSAPLVIKHDNGPAFLARATADLLKRWQILPLVSPPYTPSYNGAIEAGIGALKVRTDSHAARHGRPGHWTLDDLAAAQCEANAFARPRGPHSPSPDESWALRASIAPERRVSFRRAVEDCRCTIRDELRALSSAGPETDLRSADRAAISRALVGLGYLQVARRLIPPPIPRRKTEDNS